MQSFCAPVIRMLLAALPGVCLAALPPAASAVQSFPEPKPRPPGAAGQSVVIATVEAFWSVEQYAKASGYVAEVKRDIGDRVKKGDVLAVLRIPELEANLAQLQAALVARQQQKKAAGAAIVQARQALAVAKSQLDGYQASLALAQVTLKRQEELSARNAATPQQLDDVRAKAKVAQATAGMGAAKVDSAQADILAAEANRDVAAAQADVAAAQIQEVRALLEYTQIIAPFDGTVTRRRVNPGDLVQAATATRTTPLFTVQQLDTVRVLCDVPEVEAPGVAVGADAEVRPYGDDGRAVKGKVTRIAGAIDPTSRTMRVEIDLPNPTGALLPGMYVQVTLWLQRPVPDRGKPRAE